VTRAVMTVLGPVDPEELGHVQLHEHLFCDLSKYSDPSDVDEPITLESLYRTRAGSNPTDMVLDDLDDAIDEMQRFAAFGGGTLVDATSLGLGRQPARLAAVSRASGVHVIMGSGYYIDAFHPDGLGDDSIDDIAARIVHDLEVGVDGVRAGIIGEIGMSWPETAAERKVLDAACLAQQETGAMLLLHPGRGESAPAEHAAAIRAAGGELTRTVISHIDRTIFDVERMVELVEATGVVLEFDLFGDESSYYPPNPAVDRPNDGMRVRWIAELIERGLVEHITISQDICRKTRLTRWGGEGYAHILRRVVPLMRARGISDADIDTITVRRPSELLAREI